MQDVCTYLTGNVIGISVSGNGKDATAAELIVRFKPNDGSAIAAYRLGAGAANLQFTGTVAFAALAYEKNLEIMISVNEDSTPTILWIALPNKE